MPRLVPISLYRRTKGPQPIAGSIESRSGQGARLQRCDIGYPMVCKFRRYEAQRGHARRVAQSGRRQALGIKGGYAKRGRVKDSGRGNQPCLTTVDGRDKRK